MNALVNDLLELSRIEAGQAVKEEIDLPAVIEASVTFPGRAREKSVDVRGRSSDRRHAGMRDG
jgi:signal transduction histidine kinase